MSLLQTYLTDHRAGAAAGLALARRFADALADTEHAVASASVATSIDADVATLDDIMRRLGIAPRRAERLLALALERLGRLKLNGRLLSRSPLSTVLEAETLAAGVLAKRRLWTALGIALVDHPVLNDVDLPELERRAAVQLATLAEIHRHAVADALE